MATIDNLVRTGYTLGAIGAGLVGYVAGDIVAEHYNAPQNWQYIIGGVTAVAGAAVGTPVVGPYMGIACMAVYDRLFYEHP